MYFINVRRRRSGSKTTTTTIQKTKTYTYIIIRMYNDLALEARSVCRLIYHSSVATRCISAVILSRRTLRTNSTPQCSYILLIYAMRERKYNSHTYIIDIFINVDFSKTTTNLWRLLGTRDLPLNYDVCFHRYYLNSKSQPYFLLKVRY